MSLLHLQLRFLCVHVGWEFLLYIYHLIKKKISIKKNSERQKYFFY